MSEEKKVITAQDIKADNQPGDYLLSVKKLAGKEIKDIVGYLGYEFGFASFKLCQIVFEDGTELGVGGEHDFPYIEQPYPDSSPPNFDEETLERLYNEDNEDE
jgi:hypothetical protein